MYFDQDKQLSFASMANEDQRIEFDGNGWKHYRKDFRETVSSLTTYPEHTKMVRLSKSNFWNVRDLSISKEQNAFVLDAKSSIGMALLYKTKKAYVQMEGQTIIGLLVLDIDKKKDNYSVDIIIIDKKFQGRGYGKKIVKYAVDELTKAGAKKLSIGVSRANPAAKQIYLNAGFKPHSIYEDGMELQLIIE
jgi:diamine N-acetyltransferase